MTFHRELTPITNLIIFHLGVSLLLPFPFCHSLSFLEGCICDCVGGSHVYTRSYNKVLLWSLFSPRKRWAAGMLSNRLQKDSWISGRQGSGSLPLKELFFSVTKHQNLRRISPSYPLAVYFCSQSDTQIDAVMYMFSVIEVLKCKTTAALTVYPWSSLIKRQDSNALYSVVLVTPVAIRCCCYGSFRK